MHRTAASGACPNVTDLKKRRMHHFDELNNVLTTPDGTPNVGALGRAPLRPALKYAILFYIKSNNIQ